MMSRKELHHRLIMVICKHCPTCVGKDKLAIESYAEHILVSYENSCDAVGVSADVQSLEELARLIKSSKLLLNKLSKTSKRKLNYLLPLQDRYDFSKGKSETGNNLLFTKHLTALSSLSDAVDKLRKLPSSKSPASVKRNYEAAIVVNACRKIWREELEGKEPPLEIHPDRKHPMADFVIDVFEVLSIGSTVSSALSSLKSLGGEDAVRLSVEVG